MFRHYSFNSNHKLFPQDPRYQIKKFKLVIMVDRNNLKSVTFDIQFLQVLLL